MVFIFNYWSHGQMEWQNLSHFLLKSFSCQLESSAHLPALTNCAMKDAFFLEFCGNLRHTGVRLIHKLLREPRWIMQFAPRKKHWRHHINQTDMRNISYILKFVIQNSTDRWFAASFYFSMFLYRLWAPPHLRLKICL